MVPFAWSPRHSAPVAPPGGRGWRGRRRGERLAPGRGALRSRWRGGRILLGAPPTWRAARGEGGRRAPRGTAGRGRRTAKLDARSSQRSAVIAEIVPEPSPPPCRPPPRELTRAARREESEAVPGTPGATQKRRGGSEAEGGPDRQTDSEGALAGPTCTLKRGRYRLPPTEVHGAAPGPPARSPGRRSQAILGWGGAGRGGAGTVHLRGPHPSYKLGLRASRRPAELCLRGLSRSQRGLHVALTPGSRPQCTRLPGASAATLGLLPGCCPGRGSLSWRFKTKAEFSQSSPGCFSACLQVPGNFFCLMEH